jgi:hypothetical protein
MIVKTEDHKLHGCSLRSSTVDLSTVRMVTALMAMRPDYRI